jgi:hypothetical protein
MRWLLFLESLWLIQYSLMHEQTSLLFASRAANPITVNSNCRVSYDYGGSSKYTCHAVSYAVIAGHHRCEGRIG